MKDIDEQPQTPGSISLIRYDIGHYLVLILYLFSQRYT